MRLPCAEMAKKQIGKYSPSWCRILYEAYESLIKDGPKLISVALFVNEFPNWPF